ncbi:MAG: hypothetical protein ACYC1U_10995 [Candidatus Aquicultorales bacterium]
MLVKALILPLGIILVLFLAVSLVRGARAGSANKTALIMIPAAILLVFISGMAILLKLSLVAGIVAAGLVALIMRSRLTDR